jgi:hypothetical protein
MAEQTGIVLTAKHNPLAWLLYFTKLSVSLDGNAQKLGWGTNTILAEPGPHNLHVSFGYMGQQRGAASTDLHVPDGGTVAVNYKMPSWMFSAGKITVNS